MELGSGMDGGLYRTIAEWADRQPDWLRSLISGYAEYGLAVFALLMVWGWWAARPAPGRAMARAWAAPVAVVAAYGINEVVKAAAREVRPCVALRVRTVVVCPGRTDWSFPSNHAVIAAAAAVAAVGLALSVPRAPRTAGPAGSPRGRRGVGWMALVSVVAALLMGASRVLVGVHYPHDVWAGWVVGAVVGGLLVWAAALLGGVVDRARGSDFGWVVFGRGEGPVGW
ncbi:hypothetical protein BIV57_09325 [Mangrovactinospora gilvigrisea]|uniref:Phosphatidic acid phosphatase type 2/haloperoxidase domain-containing protein n=1 Tax=Mangrovactinospora gilvigrisea TaxID=1428644 RepID=A0A1J7CDM7_9ACTN|nr:phosphatase PAP2 family protein [Mangrovactinospora gilvigrisea]OIV37762.1 hypothetical protein BIV57_09325 [Mangrovactinospora gilvigrisea]